MKGPLYSQLYFLHSDKICSITVFHVCSREVGLLYTLSGLGMVMALPKGMTATSSIITVSGRVDEIAANTFVTDVQTLGLNPLDQEAFVVYAVQSDLSPPDALPGVNTGVTMTLSTTGRTTTGGLNDNNVFHQHILQIRSGGPGDTVSFSQSGPECFFFTAIHCHNCDLELLCQSSRLQQWCSEPRTVQGLRSKN